MMYIGLYFLFLIFNFRGPLVYQFYYCYMLPSLNKVLLTYFLTVFRFTHKTQQEKQKQLRPCGKCFATLVLAQQGVEYL